MTTPSARTSFSGSERRRWDRLTPEARTSITLKAARRRYKCRIENLSLSGMKLSVPDGAPPEGPVVLEHKTAGRFKGQAIWRSAEALGVHFSDPETELERALQCVSLIINTDEKLPAGRRRR